MSDRNRRETGDLADDSRKSSGMPIGTGSNNASADKIKQEVENLSKKRYPLSPSDIAELYRKYKNDDAIIDEIIRLRTKRHQKVKKQAQQIAEIIHRKYSSGTRPLHEILDKMMKYKTRHNWSDSEYDEFRKELQYLLTGTRAMEIDYNQNIVANRSRINKALGSTRITREEIGLNIKESENGTLSEILSMYKKSLSLHKSVFMHSLMYEDCSLVAMTGKYNREHHTASNHIHPLIACMFLPKFEIFEIHMLYSNFGSIINSRYEKKPIVNEPDSLLFYDITSDPNDVVCDINSPMADIRNRYRVQINLWETVLKLRSGNYYDAGSIGEFITTLNACRNNLYDNADLAYGQDEGSMLRRLLSVFSLRPTIIYTKPIYSVASFAAGPFGMSMGYGSPYGQQNNFGNNFTTGLGLLPFNNQPVYTITSIPMITLQIPPFTVGAEPKDLRTATSQTIWINENKTIVPKEQSIIHSKEVLIFYVNRRIQQIQIRTYTNPMPFSQLPLSMSSFEKLNAYPINVPAAITLGNSEETYQLRSVVAVTQTEIRQGEKTTNIITGSTGLIMTPRNFARHVFEQKYYLYDPFGASLPVRHPESGMGSVDGVPCAEDKNGFILNKPISFIEPIFTPEPNYPGGTINMSFFDRATHHGTIYIYAKDSGYDPSQLIMV